MDLKIYTNPECVWSKELKTWLKKRKLAFEEHDLSESDQGRDEVLAKSGQLVTPTIVIDNQVIVGFDEEALAKATGKIIK